MFQLDTASFPTPRFHCVQFPSPCCCSSFNHSWTCHSASLLYPFKQVKEERCHVLNYVYIVGVEACVQCTQGPDEDSRCPGSGRVWADKKGTGNLGPLEEQHALLTAIQCPSPQKLFNYLFVVNPNISFQVHIFLPRSKFLFLSILCICVCLYLGLHASVLQWPWRPEEGIRCWRWSYMGIRNQVLVVFRSSMHS